MASELERVKTQLGAGLLAFPVTHFKPDLAFDEPAYRANLQANLAEGPAGLFCPGGTGEFFSLTLEECRRVVAAAVAEAGGRVPIIAGVGYGTAMAIEFARTYGAERIKRRELGAESAQALPCINHPVFKGKPVNIDPREEFVRNLLARRGDLSASHGSRRTTRRRRRAVRSRPTSRPTCSATSTVTRPSAWSGRCCVRSASRVSAIRALRS